jgi:hypothetical protein
VWRTDVDGMRKCEGETGGSKQEQASKVKSRDVDVSGNDRPSRSPRGRDLPQAPNSKRRGNLELELLLESWRAAAGSNGVEVSRPLPRLLLYTACTCGCSRWEGEGPHFLKSRLHSLILSFCACTACCRQGNLYTIHIALYHRPHAIA